MKNRLCCVIVPSLAVAAFLAIWLMVTGAPPYLDQRCVSAGCLSWQLPENKGQARTELARARMALSRIKPSRPYIVIDTHANVLTLRTGSEIFMKAACSTGSGGELINDANGRRWVFNTPRGVFRVKSKLEDPWWRKPDWFFIEENEPIPSDPGKRLDPEMLGEYALGFGDDYFIHGTIYERLLGVSVTHGCVRLGSEDLKKLYHAVAIGTPIYIF